MKYQIISKLLFMRTLLIAIGLLAFCAHASIYDQYYTEARKIAEAMTLEQKIGQTIQADIQGITEKEVTDPNEAVKLALGSLLISGNAAPTTNGNLAKLASLIEEEKNKQTYLNATAENWKKLTDRLNSVGVQVTTKDNKKYSIALLLGTDAVHGDQHSLGTVLFPHNIGLSCSHNEGNFQNLGFWTKQGVKKSGFNYAFAPCVAVSHNPQWGRFYETMGQEDEFIQKYAQSFVKGLQDVSNGKINGVLGSGKHFFGDGSTHFGANEGTARVSNFKNYISHNAKGYAGAINSEVGSVMVSYSSINFVPNSYNSVYLQGLLRTDLNFGGFTISDYNELMLTATMTLPRTFMNISEDRGYAMLINNGVDMVMLSAEKSLLESQLNRVIKEAKKAVQRGFLFQDRLTEAVTRILQVKFAMGLIKSLSEPLESSQPTPVTFPESSSTNEYQDSLQAVRESLVVLKNSNVLPAKSLFSDIKYVVLVGEEILNVNRLTKIELFRNFDNIGMQCGGWSVRWQGFEGNDFWTGDNKVKSNASSILDALKAVQQKNNFQIIYPNYTTLTSEVKIEEQRRTYINNLKNARKNMTSKNTLIIGVFGEVPYAQSQGDVNIPYCKGEERDFCLYNPSLNPYVSGSQKRDLTVGFSKFQTEVITEVRGADKSIPLISVLLAGRPVPIKDIYETSSAVIAAWLPGTSGGQGIVDAITGDYVVRQGGSSTRKNTLSVDWPRSMDGLENFPIYASDGQIPQIPDIQFPVGFGLSTEGNSNLVQED